MKNSHSMNNSHSKKNIVVLVSGSGSNLQAILDACESHTIDASVKAVFSNKAEAFGLERAKSAGVDAHSVNPKEFNSREEFDHELMVQIDAYQPDLIVLAGYMRILSSEFVRHYAGKMVNIHPLCYLSIRGCTPTSVLLMLRTKSMAPASILLPKSSMAVL